MFSTGTNLASKTQKSVRFLLSTGTISRKKAQKNPKNPLQSPKIFLFVDSLAGAKNVGFRYFPKKKNYKIKIFFKMWLHEISRYDLSRKVEKAN